MLDFELHSVGTYRFAQAGTMTLRDHAVSLNLSGLRYYRTVVVESIDPGPCLIITPANTEHTFEYDTTRENRVVLFAADGVRVGARPGMVGWRDGGRWVELPAFVPLRDEEVPTWCAVWDRMAECHSQPVPENTLQAKFDVLRVMAFMLEHASMRHAPSPEEALRMRIDADARCEKSIAAHARAVGYSADHLRERFLVTFGMSPREYRVRRRVGLAMDMIVGSTLTVKEIARRLGFRHVSHLSALFREQTGRSPSEAICALRQRPGM